MRRDRTWANSENIVKEFRLHVKCAHRRLSGKKAGQCLPRAEWELREMETGAGWGLVVGERFVTVF